MAMQSNIHVVIMAGGIGSRFWPMSTPAYPKQFIDVMGVGKSMIQLTAERFLPFCSMEHIWVVTSSKYVDIVKEQLPGIPDDNILAEPEARNTAPCIGYACWKINKRYPHANIVVTPSDAFINDVDTYRSVIREALDFTEKSSAIVTVGIRPSRPETGYGYILENGDSSDSKVVKVVSFKEKPNLATAIEYLKAGHYLWNAGIFVWNVDTIVNAFRKYVPQLASIMDEMAVDFYTDKESATLQELFPTCEKISIDYAVMEKSDSIYTIAADFGWSDVGTWGSLQTLLPRDNQANAVVGEKVKLFNCSNCVVHVDTSEPIVLEGLNGYIVAEREGRLLVCRLSEEQRIKEFTAE